MSDPADSSRTPPVHAAGASSWPASDPHSFGSSGRLRTKGKVLPEHARGHNRSLVLQTLYHEGEMSRADLSRQTGLTRVTISDLVAEFIADGIVVEKGVRESSGPGKPAILVDMDRTGHRIVGIDLSLPGVFEGGLMSLDGEVIERREVPRPAGGDDAYEAVQALAVELAALSTVPILGVGVGAPGIVRPDGVVLSSPNLGWSEFPLERKLAAALDLPVTVRNDANAAVLAEYTFGAARSDTLFIKVGRGVGAGLISGSQPLVGSRFAAGEIGHVVVGAGDGPLCVCGRHGCLEAWLNAASLRERVEAADTDAAREVVLRDAGERLAVAVAPIVAALDLSEIVLSGPADLLDGTLIGTTRDVLRDRTLEGVFGDIDVRLTRQDDIVLRGAAVMVLSAQLGVS
ncbi:ROK family transcriptional regulator [Microbacterium pseudoresistens]|uniref:Putative NBD/HSP70 family sugar kinase n=1 Tax=Microbacterium pseudoresistens TaxID=640634 RepID=A0A7Y9JL80_9MICO|nr:ROK family transcriptional regulator [Microbacterium pseudoresistens]NYD53422.1 putative NBD/HSP70 family sugar kinase [Microbacterium pseudoresistens]